MSVGQARWIFLRSLTTMVSAGVPLHRALESVGKQFPEGRYRTLAEDVGTGILKGLSLSGAVAKQSWFFPAIHRALLRVGEQTGALVRVLQRLGDYDEKNLALRRLLQSRLSYPAVLLVVAMSTLFALPPLVLEGLFTVIENSGVEPPALTAWFIWLSRVVRHPLVLLLLTVGLLCLPSAWKRLWTNSDSRRAILSIVLHLPAFGKLLRQLTQVHFAQALELQLEVGLSPLKALPSSALATGNPLLVEQVEEAVRALKEGANLEESLGKVPLLSPLLVSMVGVGEQSGELPKMLGRGGRILESQMEDALDVACSLLEPLILGAMGILFGVMLVATMLPMVRLVENL